MNLLYIIKLKTVHAWIKILFKHGRKSFLKIKLIKISSILYHGSYTLYRHESCDIINYQMVCRQYLFDNPDNPNT